jgi:alpha-aminoadipic semialdehyde synthase
MEQFIPYLNILVNCIYWTEDYPRILTKEYLKNQTVIRSNLNLKVVGDISCDIDGSIEITHKATYPDNPTFTYNALEDTYTDGNERNGVTVMAVDNLPCEFPAEASESFSSVLKDYVNELVSSDFSKETANLQLPDPISRALILHNGQLTKDYDYMKEYIK